MGAEILVGLILLIAACVAFAIFYEDQGIKGVASTIDDLPNEAVLLGSTLWHITILRKSGYLHDVREVLGDASEPISKALTSCRRSGIYNIIITKNEAAILEFYSANQNGRGKAIGGFRITPANEEAAQAHANSLSSKAKENSAQIFEMKRLMAKSILNEIKAGFNEKQAEVLGSLTEEQIIDLMADQISGEETVTGTPFNFLIPVNFTDSDGNSYGTVTLTVNHKLGSASSGPFTEKLVSKNDINNDASEDLADPQTRGVNEPIGFPVQDAWEGSVYELGGRPLRCDVKIGFNYIDSNGAATSRQIRTKAFVPWLDGDHMILGYCNHRKSNRSFITGRMTSIYELETGEIIENIDSYLNEKYEQSEYKEVDYFIDNRMDVVECLLYISKLDGNTTRSQNAIINSYVVNSIGVSIMTHSVASSLIKDFADDLTPQQFRKLVDEMQKERTENLVDLKEMSQKIVSSRRGSTAVGEAALAMIFNGKRR